MPITCDAEFPSSIAQLVQAFNRCADGHEMIDVVEAAGNLFAAALHNYGDMRGMSEEEMMHFARSACKGVYDSVRENWKRQPQSTDIEVQPQ